ncbi:GyrI-like domain-containing protein [Galbibacter sp. EGI 63066]|uniref:AraC family transcriptional regulator n=1 Tax=Galbibacter sp. EGI 63066 TaxID=2993559 RepID=UPI002248CF2D|nr:GyrI-like domain-containing protein [Galbibacter sp. EGI 63066]MCX2680493.1 GyrI-like domain-containing protein [Galbibacter sp. EGI 63066]
MPSYKKEIPTDHKNKINRVFQYIDENLDGDLSLNTVSKIAFFSPFHFHRIFKTITGETLNEYVTRRRIERSASILLHKKNISITELSLRNGFTNNASFTRTFKKFYGVSPTTFRKQNPNKFSKIRQLKSKNGQEYPDFEKYICVINNLKKWITMNAKIKIVEMPKLELAYVSCIGPQNLGNAYEKLMKWATPKGLLDDEQTKMVTIYHDSFKITAADKVRMSACILLNEPTETDGEIGLSSIDQGKCIVGSFEIGLHEFEKSWTGLFLWMNENGYKKAERNPIEIYHNNFNEHPEKKCMVDLCIPIQ